VDSDIRYYPANLCRLLGFPEFSRFGSDLGEAIGEAVEKTAIGALGKRAAEHLLVAAGEGATLAGQRGPRRQWSVAVERGPKEPLKVSERFCLTPSRTSEIMRTPSTICAAAKAVAQLP
jgi:hypothetical protein